MMINRTKLLFVLAIPAFILSLLAISSFAAWSEPVKISDSAVHAVVSQVTTDTKGYIHVVWDETDLDWTRPNPGIYYSRWNGDMWSAPLKISPDPSTGFAENPAIASDSNDIVHVVYADDTYGPEPWSSRIAYTKRNPADGTWTTPVQLPDPPGDLYWTWNPKIAVDSSNNLHVSLYTTFDRGRIDSIYYTKWEGAGWSTPELVSHTETMDQLTDSTWSVIRSDKLGNVHLIYRSRRQGILYRKLTGGVWSTPVQVTTDDDIEYTEMTIDDAGNPYVVWFRTENNSVWVRRTDGGAWQTAEQVSINAVRSWWGWPMMGITTTSKGLIAVGWGEEGTGGTVDIVYKYFDGHRWSDIDRILTGRINADNPYLWRDLWDNQHLVWTELSAATKWELWYSVIWGTQEVIGTSGGTAISQIGSTQYVTLTIPKDALSADTEIAILIGPLPESFDPANVTIPRGYTFGPSGQTFTSPVTAVFTYTVEELADADPRDLGVYVWDSTTSSWSYKTGTVKTAQKTVTIDLNNFSLFGLSARRVLTTFEKPIENNSYEMVSGAAVAVRFTLKYLKDKEPITEADSVEVVLATPKGDISFPARHTQGGHWVATLRTAKLGLAPGTYKATVKLNGATQGSFSLILKAKGKK